MIELENLLLLTIFNGNEKSFNGLYETIFEKLIYHITIFFKKLIYISNLKFKIYKKFPFVKVLKSLK